MTRWPVRRVRSSTGPAAALSTLVNHDHADHTRHTAATRMANDPTMTLAEVQAVLRHADINVTGRYMTVRIEDMFDKLQEHYQRPRPQRTYSPGYDPDDIRTVFGG